MDTTMDELKYHFMNKKIIEVKMSEEVNLDDVDGITILKDKGYNLKFEVDTSKKNIKDVLSLLNQDNIIDINISNVPLEDIISSIYKKGK
jgi:ABC-2 type transport system ATP-binding protein